MDGKITVGMVVVVVVDSRKRVAHPGMSGKAGLGSGISGLALLEGVSIGSGSGISAILVSSSSSGISAAIESSSGKYGIYHSLRARHISKGLMMSSSIGVTYGGVSQPPLETYPNLSVQTARTGQDAASIVLVRRRLFMNMIFNCYL